MSKTKEKKSRGPAQTTPAVPGRRRLFILLAGVVLLIAIFLWLTNRRLVPTTHQETGGGYVRPPALSPDAEYRVTVERAKEIDFLFQRVYNDAWEAANGAIGEAFLYAATGDPNLLDVYLRERKLTEMANGTWVDDRAWVCLAELYWWEFSGRKHQEWVKDAMARYDEARGEGRLSHNEGFWSWYSYAPDSGVNDLIITNSNTNQMVTVAGMLYEATKEKKYFNDAMLAWNGDATYPGIEKTFYKGDGVWEGKPGRAAFGKQLPWEGASYLSQVAEMYKITRDPKFLQMALLSARRIMDPANGWVDPEDYFQLKMDGNGAFVHFILDAYMLEPDSLSDIPEKIGRMLEHVWSNHHGGSYVLLHRLDDNGIRNGWNPRGGEEGYGVDQVGTVHAQSQAVRAFGVFAYALKLEMERSSAKRKE